MTRNGFTLLEVVVALAVLAIGFGFGFTQMSDGLGWIDRSATDEAAAEVAQSVLARVGHDIPLVDGMRDGTESGLRWHVETTPYGTPATDSFGGLIGHTVVVTVSWDDRDVTRKFRLATVRLGPRPL